MLPVHVIFGMRISTWSCARLATYLNYQMLGSVPGRAAQAGALYKTLIEQLQLYQQGVPGYLLDVFQPIYERQHALTQWTQGTLVQVSAQQRVAARAMAETRHSRSDVEMYLPWPRVQQ